MIKIILIGFTGAGKTSLAKELAYNKAVEDNSGQGLFITRISIDGKDIYLWDLPSLVDYLALERLYSDNTSLGILTIEGGDKAASEEFSLRHYGIQNYKILIAKTKIDLCNISINPIFLKKYDIIADIGTSIVTGDGIDDLKIEISKFLDTRSIEDDCNTYTNEIKNTILEISQNESILLTFPELYNKLKLSYSETLFSEKILKSTIEQLEIEGRIKQLNLSNYLLLRPEIFYEAAIAIAYSARYNEEQKYALSLKELFGNYNISSLDHLPSGAKNLLIKEIVYEFLEKEICINTSTNDNEYILFPRQIKDLDELEWLIKKTKLYSELTTSQTNNIQSIFIEEVNMSDKYINNGNSAAFGKNAKVTDSSFSLTNQVLNAGVDIRELSAELSKLRKELQKNSKSAEDIIETGAIAKAEKYANDGDKELALEELKKAGKWSFDTATSIGVNLVSELLKTILVL